MKKRPNFGMIFAIGVGAFFLYKQLLNARAAKAAQAAELTRPLTVGTSISREAYETPSNIPKTYNF